MRIRLRIARAIALVGLVVLLGARAGRAETIGWIDGGYWANGQYNVSGWACDRGSRSSVWVALADPSSGSTLVWAFANQPSDAAVANACSAPGATNLRFNIPLPGGQEEAFVGRPVRVNGRSNSYPWALRAL